MVCLIASSNAAAQTFVSECAPGATRTNRTTATPPGWSLGPRGANVAAAISRFFGSGGAGRGVVIVQPDTGYRPHGATKNAYMAHSSWDFLSNDDDPLDDTVKGKIQFPGHGTRTGSVIISPPEFKLGPSSAVWVTGVAPAATWIPARVTNRVILIDRAEYDIDNVASAIRHASGGNRSLIKRQADIISMSLGGTPKRELKEALEFAENNGVIVLAAAGNVVKTVVWPANYDSVISVAATNYSETLWADSAYIGRVKIAAPGEDVWTAVSERTVNGFVDCVEPGSGTSFAVATMAGVAALWISRHAESKEFKELRYSAKVPAAFRTLLNARRSNSDSPFVARRPTGWNNAWGPGIIDAEKLLCLTLPTTQELSSGQYKGSCSATCSDVPGCGS
ncbi:MAG: S8 family serine peptidase [Vicinamibacterales bacterium]